MPRRQIWTLVLTAALALPGMASAQAPVDLRGRLDASSGGTLLGNKPGPSIGRTPPSAYHTQAILPATRNDRLTSGAVIPDMPLPLAGPERPRVGGTLGDLVNGMSLGDAIARMVQCNPDVVAARTVLDQARSDIVTAGLRTNPQFFADMASVPYRVFSPGQADVNFAQPVDVSGKRKARVKSAVCVLRSVEWSYQNFIRTQIDNLETVFVDALAAQVTLDELKLKKLPPVTLNPTSASPVVEAQGTLRDKTLMLAMLLNVGDPRSIRLKGPIYDPRTFNPDLEDDDPRSKATLDALKRIARENRPDLHAKRWDLRRAEADVDAVLASRLDDVTFLVQPYTYNPGLPNHVGWAFGVTIPVPIYNRQQGNLAKAHQIVAQTRALLTSVEHTVSTEVEAAYNDVRDTRDDSVRFLNKIREDVDLNLPEDDPMKPTDEDLAEKLEFMNKYLIIKKREDVGSARRNYFNTVIAHQKSLLRVATACACPPEHLDGLLETPPPPARPGVDGRPPG